MIKVLLIEDDPEIKDLTLEMLKEQNYYIVTASNGKEGLEQIKIHLPDIVLSDIMMPEMDGYELLSLIRKDDELKSIPFIFISGRSEREDIRKGMNLSADDYLIKPFAKEELINSINARLERSLQLKDYLTNHLKIIELKLSSYLNKKNLLNYDEIDTIIDNLKKALEEKQNQINKMSFINSHLLRGAVSNIMGYIELTKSNPNKNEEAISNISQITQKIDETIKEVNKLLGASNNNEVLKNPIVSKKTNIKSVYFVDDDNIQLTINSLLVQKISPDVKLNLFSDPREALDKIIDMGARPDKLFLDLYMPIVDGWKFLDTLQKHSITIDVAILTSSIAPSDIQKSKEYSMVSSFISKPLTKEKLASILYEK